MYKDDLEAAHAQIAVLKQEIDTLTLELDACREQIAIEVEDLHPDEVLTRRIERAVQDKPDAWHRRQVMGWYGRAWCFYIGEDKRDSVYARYLAVQSRSSFWRSKVRLLRVYLPHKDTIQAIRFCDVDEVYLKGHYARRVDAALKTLGARDVLLAVDKVFGRDDA